MKVIDLLNKIANGEIKQGTKFEMAGCEYVYNNGYIARDNASKTMESFYIYQRLLDDEVIILDEEDEFTDIEEITSLSPTNVDALVIIVGKINDLIKNQKKIINKLNLRDF